MPGTAPDLAEAARSLRYPAALDLAGLRPDPPSAARVPGPRAIPPAALRPWPLVPPAAECAAQPARWAALRAARDPVPPVFEGVTGMASRHRALGQPVELALRASPAGCWWYDPELPLSLIMGGLPSWDRDGRCRGGGDAWEFAAVVEDYEREMEAGSVFPPIFAIAVEPGDGRNHYLVGNGRHRAVAAWRCGYRTFPAYVVHAAALARLVMKMVAANGCRSTSQAGPGAGFLSGPADAP